MSNFLISNQKEIKNENSMVTFIDKLYQEYKEEVDEFKNILSKREVEECSTSMEDCLFLYLLVRYFKPKSILEIGTFVGSTLFALISACQKNDNKYIIHTIDISDSLKLDESLLNNVKIYKGWSKDVLKKINTPFDFIFSDANLDRLTAIELERLSNQNTIFATHDFVPPYDKGISSMYNMIKFTKLGKNKLIKPHYKCNWIYELNSFENIHENFSKEYIIKNKFNKSDFNRSHLNGVNNCIAILINNNKLKNLDCSFDEAIEFIDNDNKNIKKDWVIKKNNLYIRIKKEKLVIINEFKDDIPYVKKVAKLI